MSKTEKNKLHGGQVRTGQNAPTSGTSCLFDGRYNDVSPSMFFSGGHTRNGKMTQIRSPADWTDPTSSCAVGSE